MPARVIALSGWKGSGKDTVAAYLQEAFGYQKLSFAAALKDVVASTYKVSREDLDDPTKKEMPLFSYPVIPTDGFTEVIHSQLSSELRSGFWTPRALAILEGSIKRAVYPNYWVQAIVSEILNNPNQRYVITDMRFRSEADTLRTMLPDIDMWRINRFTTIDTNSTSERDLDQYPFDIYLANHLELTNLRELINNIIEMGA